MLRVISSIQIIQETPYEGEIRDKILVFDFAHKFECDSSWRNLTNTGTVTVPKNLYVKDTNNKLVPLNGTNVNVGGFTTTPLLMRGDKVILDWGYRYFRDGKEVYESTYDAENGTHLFEGWISEVTSKKPITFKIEDNFWQLKQIAAPLKTFSKTDTLEDIASTLLEGTGFTVNALTSTTFGSFRVGNETVAEVFSRLRKTYRFESFFKGNELRVGSAIYVDDDVKEHTFTFQQNIIEDSLTYKRKDDMVLSIVASNKIVQKTGGTTKDGKEKTKRKRIECLVTLSDGSDDPVVFIKEKGEDYPSNTGGERLKLTYPGAKTTDDLIELATAEIKKYYYTGFKGKFSTFGMPYVRMGDNVILIDPILPERNGTYKVRSVSYEGGVGGLRQNVELDYKILI